MKAEAGWSAAALAVATFIGVSLQLGGKTVSAPEPTGAESQVLGRQSTSASKDNFQNGPCGSLEGTIRTFLLAPKNDIIAPPSCGVNAQKNPDSTLKQRAGKLQFVIAILPDPVHTHFSLAFDREAEAIQQGVQDEGYFYDSSWLPWDTEEKPLVLLSDQDKADDERKAREAQPGLILFRKKQDLGESDPAKPLTLAPYEEGLAVFIVGEDPTSGVHKQQFENAVDWIAALRPLNTDAKAPPQKPVNVLGPTFSGSLPSLAQLLTDYSQGIAKLDASRSLSIYSGSVTSNALVNWFASPQREIGPVHFYSFQHSDDINLNLYRDYLINQGFEIGRLAIISEDETAYGGFSKEDPGSLCKPRPAKGDFKGEGEIGPTCLYYPRDISALRDAYQKEGIFSASATQQAADAAKRTLTTNLADPRSKVQDTIRSYSGDLTALSQEAVLLQIVSMLRAHESQYVVLRSSNPLDQLFLSHFLRLEYPEGRIVLEGSDLLLRRETGAATLSGIMTLNTYPLLPWEYDWTAPRGSPPYLHSHRVFAQDLSVGTYVASRFMVHTPNCVATQDKAQGPSKIFLPQRCSGLEIPDYGPPFWMVPKTEAERESFKKEGAEYRPATWLSVLGRDGFWPVAAMVDENFDKDPEASAGPIESLFNMALTVVGVRDSTEAVDGRPAWLPMPLSMKMYLFALLLWSGFHLYCCARPSLTKPSYRAHFVRVAGKSHRFLILFGSINVAFVPILLAWGYGAMSLEGEPVPNGWFYRAPLLLVWVMAGLAIVANINDDLKHGVTTNGPKGKMREQWRALSRRTRVAVFLAAYLLTTLAFYWIVFLSLDRGLNSANRVFTYFRSIHLSTGVSPLVPLISLSAGLYLWFWYSLHGLALFGKSRPRLPPNDSLGIVWLDKSEHSFLSMVSAEAAGRPIEHLCGPFSAETLMVTAVLSIVLYLAGLALGDGHIPIRSLGSVEYSRFYYIAADLCVSLMLANAWQLVRIWRRLRQMLVFLDRIPLRRTMEGLKGYSWGSVWKMGGNILDVRNKLFYREFESLTHISNCLRDDDPGMAEIKVTQAARADFADWYNRTWDDSTDRDLSKLELCQRSIAKTAGILFAKVLVPHWRLETDSLVQNHSDKKSIVVEVAENKPLLLEVSAKEEDETDPGKKSAGDSPEILRNAEEFVCMVYMGFVQNILGRMRTLTSELLWLYVAVTISVATYPFDPRPVLSGAMLLAFLILGAVIATVYSQMHRDATLSHVTNTKPGELGLEFWFKLIGFGAGPLLGLLATVFPELTGSLFSWLQPGIASMK